MTKKLMAVLGALVLVGCGGSGKPWSGEAPDVDGGWPTTGGGWVGPSVGGSVAAGGSDAGLGGYEAGGSYGVAGTGTGVGGYEAGGSYAVGGTGIGVGGYGAGGSYAVGGTGIGVGGYGNGGSGYGGVASGGTGSQDPLCSQNVVHCFDAAANCYQYSPSSDCDQIVDVCAAMQMECNE